MDLPRLQPPHAIAIVFLGGAPAIDYGALVAAFRRSRPVVGPDHDGTQVRAMPHGLALPTTHMAKNWLPPP